MFGLGIWELMLIFAIVLLIFGGKRLPGLASGLGSAIRNFKNEMNGTAQAQRNEIAAAEQSDKTQAPPKA